MGPKWGPWWEEGVVGPGCLLLETGSPSRPWGGAALTPRALCVGRPCPAWASRGLGRERAAVGWPVGVTLSDRVLARSDVLTHVRTQLVATCSLAGRRARSSWWQPQKFPRRVCSLMAGADPLGAGPLDCRCGGFQTCLSWGMGMEPCSEEGAESSRAWAGGRAGALSSSWPSHPHFPDGETEAQRGQGLFQSHTARWKQHSRFTVDLENPWRPEPYFPESPGGWHPCLWPQFPHLGSGLTVTTWQSPREVREAPANSQCHLPLLPTPSTQIKGSDAPGPHSHNKGPPGGHWWHEATCPLPLSDGHMGEKGPEEGRGQRAGPGGHRAGAAGLECPWGSMQGRLRMLPRQELGWILRVAGGHCGCGTVSPGS